LETEAGRINRILVATDDSDFSRHVAEVATSLARGGVGSGKGIAMELPKSAREVLTRFCLKCPPC
jgi:hypothetical protein